MFGFLSRVKPDCAHRLMEDRMRTCQIQTASSTASGRIQRMQRDRQPCNAMEGHGGRAMECHGTAETHQHVRWHSRTWVAPLCVAWDTDVGSPAL